MEEIRLDVQVRDQFGSGKVKKIRAEKFIPAIIYGEGKAPTPVKVDRRAYERIMRAHQGENVIFHLNVLEGEKKLRDYAVIIKEEQHDAVSDGVLHIDFYRISLTKQIEVNVGIVTKGEAVGVKRDGGSLEHNLWELDVVCLPMNIPAHIEVDVSALEIGQAIHVKDLVLPQGVATNHDPEAVVATVVPPMKEAVPEEGAAQPELEVIKEKPKEKTAEKKPEEAVAEKK